MNNILESTMTKNKKRHYLTIVSLCYEKRSSCSWGCRLLAVTPPVAVFPCCSVLSTTLPRRRVDSLAVPNTFWSWMVLLGCVTAPWFHGIRMFLTMWRSLIIQHVTTTIKMKQTALSGSVSMTVQFLRKNLNKPLKKSPARKKYILNEK